MLGSVIYDVAINDSKSSLLNTASTFARFKNEVFSLSFICAITLIFGDIFFKVRVDRITFSSLLFFLSFKIIAFFASIMLALFRMASKEKSPLTYLILFEEKLEIILLILSSSLLLINTIFIFGLYLIKLSMRSIILLVRRDRIKIEKNNFILINAKKFLFYLIVFFIFL